MRFLQASIRGSLQMTNTVNQGGESHKEELLQSESGLPSKTLSFWSATLFWLKLGFISFGGPAGQIAIMHKELVENRHWISERRFLHALNYCMLLPGPEAQQLTIYIGWLMHRTWGAIVAGILFLFPSLLIMILLSWIYIAFGDMPLVAGLFYGIKPAITVIVAQAVQRIGKRILKNNWLWAIAAASFFSIFIANIPFPLIVIAAALVGYIGSRISPDKFVAGGNHGKNETHYGPAIIDDETPSPEHTKFSYFGLVKVVLIGSLLWIGPMTLLTATFGWSHPFTQMSWFFTKAALLTFGGAYAVLPYVYQGAVTHYGWLTPTQMIDGLALGETTPGPLIMVVAFVGFVGGYTKGLLGPESEFLAGAAAAILVTWFTFLPSFIFILMGGPIVESTRSEIKFIAPLTAITAAVVGVVLNLAIFFAYHVMWPEGYSGKFDVLSALITLVAGLALFTFRKNVILVICLCGMLGLIVKTLAINIG